MPRRAITDSEIDRCFHVMAELRPQLKQNSGTHRVRALKFNFAQGFNIASYHFSEALD